MSTRFMPAAVHSLLLLLIATTGCSTVAKQAYYTAIGAKGSFYEVQVVQPDTLARYHAIRIEPFANELGPHVPADVMREVNRNVPAAIEEEGLFRGNGPRLVASGRVIHYTGKSGLMGAVGSVISGGQVCVCRVQLHDDASGDLIGEAVCWGAVKSAIRRGSDEFGEGVGKGVAKWIERRLPDDELQRRREAAADDGA